MEVNILIFKVALLLIIGVVGAIFSRRFKLPSVTGYVLFGLLLGPSLGLIIPNFKGVITAKDVADLSWISDITLGFIGFAIGGELSYRFLKRSGKTIMTITMFEVIGAVLVVFLGLLFVPKPAPLMNGYTPFHPYNIAFSLVLASMSAATAPAATLMVVKQFRTHGPLTKAIVPITAMDDVSGITVFGFAISIAMILVTGAKVTPLMVFQPFIEIIGSIIIGAVIGLITVYLKKKFAKTKDNYLVFALISILLTNVSIYFLNELLAPYSIAFSQIFANIILGAIIANIGRESEKTFQALQDFTTPFFIVFFTIAGASLDLNIFKSDLIIIIIAVIYIIARGIGIILGTSVGARITKQPETLKKYLGFALLPQGGVSLSLLVVVRRQFFDTLPAFYNIILTVVMLSIIFYETTGPIFSKFALTKAGEIHALDKFKEYEVNKEYVSDNLEKLVEDASNIGKDQTTIHNNSNNKTKKDTI